MNQTLKTSVTAAAALLLATTLAACNRPGETTAGEKLDNAIAKTEQSAQNASAEARQEGRELRAEAGAAADRMGDKIDSATDKVSDKVADAAITASVNAELAKDSQLSALKINVDTRNGQVLLKGQAPDAAARARATQLAMSVKGVTAVDNQLEVRG